MGNVKRHAFVLGVQVDPVEFANAAEMQQRLRRLLSTAKDATCCAANLDADPAVAGHQGGAGRDPADHRSGLGRIVVAVTR
jgi:hypothetical protein